MDLRSDTVTKPSPDMWNALKSLTNDDLGDDVFGEDPTVNELEKIAAKITGKEAALLVTSGTQGNLISLLSSTSPGDEILIEEQSHIFHYEVGGAARIGGLTSRTFSTLRGTPKQENLQPLIRERNDLHQAWTTLLAVENTHNKHGGTIVSPLDLKLLKEFCTENDLKFHMDGARIFNAAVALGMKVKDFAQYVDSLTFCLSKGLSCPVGSIIVGDLEFIQKSRKYRKMLGGGMRQAGILASMGLIALKENWIKRLAEDHQNAKLLAKGLQELTGSIIANIPETNIVIAHFNESISINEFVNSIRKKGVLVLPMDSHSIRLVTHYGITKADIDFAIQEIVESIKLI